MILVMMPKATHCSGEIPQRSARRARPEALWQPGVMRSMAPCPLVGHAGRKLEDLVARGLEVVHPAQAAAVAFHLGEELAVTAPHSQ